MDLTYLLDHLAADPFFKKFHHLNQKLAEVIQDYGLVSFVPLNVQVYQLVFLLENDPQWLGLTVFYSAGGIF